MSREAWHPKFHSHWLGFLRWQTSESHSVVLSQTYPVAKQTLDTTPLQPYKSSSWFSGPVGLFDHFLDTETTGQGCLRSLPPFMNRPRARLLLKGETTWWCCEAWKDIKSTRLFKALTLWSVASKHMVTWHAMIGVLYLYPSGATEKK